MPASPQQSQVRGDVAHDPTIRASEVGRYAYCARAWWLQYVQGYAPENQEALDRGERGHVAHGRSVARAEGLRRAARWALVVAVALMALAIASFLRG
jgi:hypothetical protein